MRVVKFHTALLGALAAPLLIAAGPADPPGARTIIAMTPSVVRIVAAGCGADKLEHVGTGFIWPGPGEVVTDLHLLVGCTGPISATFWIGKEKSAPLPAVVKHVLMARDLVLLAVANPPAEARALPVNATPPRPDDEVKVYGYPRGIAAPEDKRLSVSVQTETFPQLSSSLDGEARDQLVQLKFPRLDTEVVHLDGSLSPGHSGAPVINGAGEVVGVGSGGLLEGAAGISWAVRTEYLKELLTQSADLPAAPGPTGPLYAMLEAPPAPAAATDAAAEPDIPSITCGELTLTRQGAQTLAQMVRSSADRAAIERIASQELHVDLTAMGAERYEIWSEPESGVAVVVAPGARLVASPPVAGHGVCITEHQRHKLVYNAVELLRLPGSTTAPEWEFTLQKAKWSQLGMISRLAGVGLSDGTPGQKAWRLNGVINGAWVLRRLYRPTPNADGSAREHQAVVLRADLAGRGAYVMVAALARLGLEQMDAAAHRAWAEGVLAVYLSSFPPRGTAGGEIVASSQSSGAADSEQGEAEEIAATEVPADFAALRTYPSVACGWSAMLRLSDVVSLGHALSAAGDPRALSDLVTEASAVRPAALAAGAFDVWGQAAAGLGVFLPRGLPVTAEAGVKIAGPRINVGRGQICTAASAEEPDLRFILFSLGNRDVANADPLLRAGLETALGTTLTEAPASGGLRRFTGNVADGHAIRVWLAVADRNHVVAAMALAERDPMPAGALPRRRAVALAEDLTALSLSLGEPVLSGVH
jgi:S1-C subfamily serine protease